MTAKTNPAKNLPRVKSSACRFRSLRRKNTPRTPHRRHKCLRYTLHRLRENPLSRHLFSLYVGRGLIDWAFRLRRRANVNRACNLYRKAHIPNAFFKQQFFIILKKIINFAMKYKAFIYAHFDARKSGTFHQGRMKQ